MKFKLAVLFLSFGTMGLVAGTTSAHEGSPWYGGYGYMYRHLDYKIPYFAAYPPVYYSYPVPRPYGYSPFAYPPGTMTPSREQSQVKPAMVINPYVQAKEVEEADTEDRLTTAARAPQPLVIINPFVQSPRTVVRVSE